MSEITNSVTMNDGFEYHEHQNSLSKFAEPVSSHDTAIVLTTSSNPQQTSDLQNHKIRLSEKKTDEITNSSYISFIILALLIFFVSACDLYGKAGDKKLLEQNKDIVRRTHDEVWSRGNIALIDELYASDYVGHWSSGIDTQGLEELKKIIIKSRTDVPDLTENIEHIFAEGNLVVTHFRSNGTFNGTIYGISHNNRKVTIQEIAIHRIVKGKIVEQWTVANNLLLMQQLGIELKPTQP